MKRKSVILCLCFALMGCGVGETNTTYSRGDIGQAAIVREGIILSMKPVNIEGTGTIGAIGGAVAGGAAGSMIGGNTAVNIIGGTAGALLGGIIGSAIESEITKDTAMQFIVQLSNGQTTAVVQSNELHFRVGDKVLLITTDGTTRLQYAN